MPARRCFVCQTLLTILVLNLVDFKYLVELPSSALTYLWNSLRVDFVANLESQKYQKDNRSFWYF